MPFLEMSLLGASGALAAKSLAVHSAGFSSGSSLAAGGGACSSLVKVFSGGSLFSSHGAHAASAAAVVDGTAGGAQLLASAGRSLRSFSNGGGAQVAALSVHSAGGLSRHAAGAASHGVSAASTKSNFLKKFPTKPPTTNSSRAAVSGVSGSTKIGNAASAVRKPAARLSRRRYNPSASAAPSSESQSTQLLPSPGPKSVTITRDVAEQTNRGVVHHITKTVTESIDALEPSAAPVTISAAMIPAALFSGEPLRNSTSSDDEAPLKCSSQGNSSALQSELRRVSLCDRKNRMILYAAFL